MVNGGKGDIGPSEQLLTKICLCLQRQLAIVNDFEQWEQLRKMQNPRYIHRVRTTGIWYLKISPSVPRYTRPNTVRQIILQSVYRRFLSLWCLSFSERDPPKIVFGRKSGDCVIIVWFRWQSFGMPPLTNSSPARLFGIHLMTVWFRSYVLRFSSHPHLGFSSFVCVLLDWVLVFGIIYVLSGIIYLEYQWLEAIVLQER